MKNIQNFAQVRALSCVWIETGNARQPLACRWIEDEIFFLKPDGSRLAFSACTAAARDH